MSPVRRILKPPLVIVLAALAFRLALIVALGTYHFDPAREHYRFGREFGRVARSIATGQGFSSPFHGQSGTTAILPPVYPYLLAGIFKLFGVYTDASSLVTLTLQSLLSALTCLAVFRLGEKSFSRTVGNIAGWVFAFNPLAIYVSVEWAWETALSTLLATLVLLAAVHLDGETRLKPWLGFGLLCGFTALTNPAIVAVLPFLWVWLWYRLRRQEAPPIPLLASAALIFLLSVSPWIIRNYIVFHQFIPFRSNFGLELRMGNYPGSMGVRALALHPSQNELELEKYRRMGELAYVAEKKGEALEFIARNPGRFAEFTALRFLMWWTGEEWKIPGTSRFATWAAAGQIFGFGVESFLAFVGLVLAWHGRKKDAVPFAILLLCYPVVYYVTHPEVWFRHPLEPLMVVLCVYALRRVFYGQRADAPAGASATSPAADSA
jgi:4-amino-4-deoxy-L-arabinose transferase-like glycosyltransferase